jgi:formylglycine-generating enzyme required for sulfatase activity
MTPVQTPSPPSPMSRCRPLRVHEPVPLAGDESIDRVNAQLLTADQQEELKRLVDQGLTPPGEMVLIPGRRVPHGHGGWSARCASDASVVYVSAYWIDRHGGDERAVSGLCGRGAPV